MQVETTSPAVPTPPNTSASPAESYTILRIKRKRNEEPLDALFVESRIRRKKSRGGVGVFQYAQTVEDDAWDDATRQKAIQDKISRLAQETAAKTELKAAVPPVTAAPPSPVSRISKDEPARRYTIVDAEEPKAPSRRYPTAPPKVYSTKELEERRSQRDFKMYDAVPANEQPMVVDEPSEMDKFLPMLNDYLKIHDVDVNTSDASPALKKPSGSALRTGVPLATSNDDDYVWDVFYHRPATLSEWNEVANVGTVSGLPPSFGDGYDSASDSEEEFDEADEDSNAEEYYKNDYPEEEENSDEFHEDSDYDELIHYPA
ncbi:hypothetical protein BDZ97DRAFT_566928 [Flammula alnicola]|nr:hypothetical protein BDZ97DRAFT_566928 [Flammula alnicola]